MGTASTLIAWYLFAVSYVLIDVGYEAGPYKSRQECRDEINIFAAEGFTASECYQKEEEVLKWDRPANIPAIGVMP